MMLADGRLRVFIVVSGMMTGCVFAVGAMVRARAMAARANTDTRIKHGESEEEKGYIVPIVVRPNDARAILRSFIPVVPMRSLWRLTFSTNDHNAVHRVDAAVNGL